VYVEFAVKRIHAGSIEKNQKKKYVNGSLLSKPEPQFVPPNFYGIELIGEQDAQPEGACEPDHKTSDDKS